MSDKGNFWDELRDEKSSNVSEKVELEPQDDGFAAVFQHDDLESQSLDGGIENQKKVVFNDHLGSQTEEIHVQQVPETFTPHEPREIKKTSFPVLLLLIPAVLFVIAFALPVSDTFGLFPQSCDGAVVALDNQTGDDDERYFCDTRYDTIPVQYLSQDNVTIIESEGYGYYDAFRWESGPNVDVIGYLYSYDDSWIQFNHCEWEGDDFAGDVRWYCSYSSRSSNFDDWWFYCETDGEIWHCTDEFGQSEGYSNTSGQQRYVGGEGYSCVKVVRESRMSEFTSSEYESIVSSMEFPQWCYDSVNETYNSTPSTVLPFDGERVFFAYWTQVGFEDEWPVFDGHQYSSSYYKYSELDTRPFDSDGQVITSSTLKMTGVVVLIAATFLLGLLLYALATLKTHVMHLGVENTVVVMSSWLNKPAKVKKSIQLDHTSYLRRYTTTSTDSDGTTSTSTHHEIRTNGQPTVKMPDRFSGKELSEVTGLKIGR